MRNRNLPIFFVLAVLLSLLAIPTAGTAQKYQPSVGQEGKDVVWVPTPEALVAAMLDMAKVTPSDYVIDLGSGDGRIVIAAAKRGAHALGIEFNPEMVELSRLSAQNEGVSDKANFMQADFFEADFSKATVLTMYLLPSLNIKLRPKILEMKPGTRVVTHAFNMEDWEPDQTTSADDRTAYLWIVPAKVGGAWTWKTTSGGAELTLKQNYQKIEGTLMIDGQELPLKDAKLQGDRISFSVGVSQAAMQEYSGLVNGRMIVGLARAANGREIKWSAERRADR